MEEPRKRPDLSEREQQLITLAAEGLTDTAIASRLGISEPTVKSYWGRVRSKLGPYNRTELVAHSLKEAGEIAVVELNGEIKRLLAALDESSDALNLHREMLESAPDSVFAVDQDGCFVWMNTEAERMFGYQFDEIVGKHVCMLVPEELQERHRHHMRRYFELPEKKEMGEHLATVALRKDGEVFSIVATLASIETPSGRIVSCFVREVAERDALAYYAEQYGTVVN